MAPREPAEVSQVARQAPRESTLLSNEAVSTHGDDQRQVHGLGLLDGDLARQRRVGTIADQPDLLALDPRQVAHAWIDLHAGQRQGRSSSWASTWTMWFV